MKVGSKLDDLARLRKAQLSEPERLPRAGSASEQSPGTGAKPPRVTGAPAHHSGRTAGSIPATGASASSVSKKGPGGRPYAVNRDKTLEATKPWVKLGMSRRTWFRRQAEKREKK